MKRLFDLLLAVCATVVLGLPLVRVALLVKLTSEGPILYWSDRVGRNNRIFRMPKFRSMQVGTPTVATHLLVDPATHLTPLAPFCASPAWTNCPSCGASSRVI